MQTQDNIKTCYQREKPKNTAKNLFATLQFEINPLVNKLEYTNIKKTLQAPTTNRLLEICLH